MTTMHVLLQEPLTCTKLTWVFLTKKSKSDKDAAKSVATKNSRSKPQEDDTGSFIKESVVQKMSPQEYEKRSDEIMEAIRTGKFVYDVSGSAR